MADVLLVDDDENVLLTLAIALRRFEHNVTALVSAPQALACLQHRRFDFLISDVCMPGMTGIELALEVRHMAESPCIILMSAHPDVKARENAADIFVQKPLDPAALNTLLTHLLHEASRQTLPSGAASESNGSKRSNPAVMRTSHLSVAFSS